MMKVKLGVMRHVSLVMWGIAAGARGEALLRIQGRLERHDSLMQKSVRAENRSERNLFSKFHVVKTSLDSGVFVFVIATSLFPLWLRSLFIHLRLHYTMTSWVHLCACELSCDDFLLI
jgi:hypothetical protein